MHADELEGFTPENLDRMAEAAVVAGCGLGDFIDAVERFRLKLQDAAHTPNGELDGH